MNIKDYLRVKYEQANPTTCLAVEAKILGIEYPLKTGWLLNHGDREISEFELGELEKFLIRSVESCSSKSEWSARGLKAIRRRRVIEKASNAAKTGGVFRDDAWVAARSTAIRQAKGHCMICGHTASSLVVSHRISPLVIPALAYDLDNLVVACSVCSTCDRGSQSSNPKAPTLSKTGK